MRNVGVFFFLFCINCALNVSSQGFGSGSNGNPSFFHHGTRRRLEFHPYVVDIPSSRTKRFAATLIVRAAEEWNSLPADVFPEHYNLDLFKVTVNRHFLVRVCVVEGKGSYKRAHRFCPILEEEESGVECVIGTDRLDCLRRIGKGTVDFGVFSPELLVAAQWAKADVLVTNELRKRSRPFEMSIVALVNRRILPETKAPLDSILRNTTLCHQGYGGEDDNVQNDILSQYLESLVTERLCEAKLSLSENRIKSMSEYFGKACIAGPWVPDAEEDKTLKLRYSSLCASCWSDSCASGDRYWGRAGALACLAAGAGDFTWARQDDIDAYFGLSGGRQYADPDQFRVLCRDGSSGPLTRTPCVWLHRPWPAIVAKRKASVAVRQLAANLSSSTVTVDRGWRGALAALLELREALPESAGVRTAADHLARSPGFTEAYSQAACDQTRTQRLCVSTLIEENKCKWMSEAATVYGIRPPLECYLRRSKQECFRDLEDGKVSVVLADTDWLVKAQRDYNNVEPFLHEITPIVDQLSTVVAYVKKDGGIKTIEDFRGKRAAFPLFDGFAWHAVSQHLLESDKGNSNENCGNILTEYFKEICAPGIEKEMNITDEVIEKLTAGCYKEDDKVMSGEIQALRSLVEGRSDVAFLSLNTFKHYSKKLIQEPWAQDLQEIVPVCPNDNEKYCFISWSSLGQLYAAKDDHTSKRIVLVNLFKKLDALFGKNYPFHTAMFSMYGQFNHKSDILFHNNTRTLATELEIKMHPYNKVPLNFESVLQKENCKFKKFTGNYAANLQPNMLMASVLLVFYFLLS